MSVVILILLCLFLLITTFFLIYVAYTNDLDEQSSLIHNISLTLVSFLGSYIVSYLFAQKGINEIKEDSSRNLIVFGTQAAEKVGNLSTELQRLSSFLSEELKSDSGDVHAILNSKNYALRNAIYAITTLKTVNDGSLSDWQSIIPNEVSTRIKEKQETQLRSIDSITEFKKILKDINKRELPEELLNEKIDSLASQVNQLINATLDPHTPIIPKVSVELPCTFCNKPLIFKQKQSGTSIKTVKCRNCQTKNRSIWDEVSGFHFTNMTNSLTEEIIERVRSALPSQPWPKGTNNIVREKLQLSKKLVSRAIITLIDRGIFRKQVDGSIVE